MNEVKVHSHRLIELINKEVAFDLLLEHLYEKRQLVKAYAGKNVVEQSSLYTINPEYLDKVLTDWKKGFKEEIEDE